MKIKRSLIALVVCTVMVSALGTPAQAAEGRPQKTVVFILAENEYRAWRTIPEFGQMLEDKYAFQCEYLTSSTDDKDPNRFFIPRMETSQAGRPGGGVRASPRPAQGADADPEGLSGQR